MSTIAFTLSLSLFDSFSTTLQIIIFVLLLSTDKPIRNSLAFLLGLSGAYILCGIAGFLTLDQLNAFLSKYFPSTGKMSDSSYYVYELLGGILMLIFGVVYYFRKRNAPIDRSHHLIISRLQSMNAIFAASMGAIISVTSFPVAIPYIVALEKYALLHLNPAVSFSYILLYNAGYALPMLVILDIFLIARRRKEIQTDTLHEKTRVLNVQLTSWTLIAVGLFSMIDAGCYFSIGHALLKGRYF